MTENTENKSNNDLKSIGIALRNKREELSYTLEHVSEITRINLTSLRNIEEGNLDNLSGLVFVKGFIRNYAKLLGIDSNWMIEVLNNEYGPKKSSENGSVENENNKTKNSSSLYMALGAIVLIFGIVGFLYWNSQQSLQIATDVETIESVQEAEGNKTDNAQMTEKVAEITEQISESTEQKPIETPINAIIHPLNLVLVSKSNDWVRLTIDDKPASDIQLSKGEKYEWPANEQYYLVMSTGDSAIIHLNGEEIEIDEEKKEMLFEMKLNKFSLTQINN